VLRNAREAFPDLVFADGGTVVANLDLLTDAGELDLIRKAAFYPSLIAGAAKAHEPHRVAFYLYDLASAFHGHWTRGNDLPQLRVIQAGDRALTAARCALVASLQHVLSSGLSVLGVGAPEAMR
jgi:arginyl-tRNA synthetase